MRIFICNCIDPDLENLNCKNIDELDELIDNAIEITKEQFLIECKEGLIKSGFSNVLYDIKEYYQDYEFFRNDDIYFIRHSGIECFFK